MHFFWQQCQLQQLLIPVRRAQTYSYATSASTREQRRLGQGLMAVTLTALLLVGEKRLGASQYLKMCPLESFPVLLKICLLKGFVDVLRLPEKDVL